MKRVYISVEGQTEETFIREILAAHLLTLEISLVPIIVTTKRLTQGNKFKGGLTSYQQARQDILMLLNDKNAAAVTTFYDLYQLPDDFPGYNSRPATSGKLQAQHLEQAFYTDINSPRFHPYLQVHEFEAFLFVHPEHTARLFTENQVHVLAELRRIRAQFDTPEDINNSPQTAPSRRIQQLYRAYDKPLYGTLAVLETGLEALRNECPHFREWLTWLETL